MCKSMPLDRSSDQMVSPTNVGRDRPPNTSHVMSHRDFEAVVMDEGGDVEGGELGRRDRMTLRTPLTKTRSLSDGGGTPKLSPSPRIFGAARRQSKDDSSIRDSDRDLATQPSTPIRAGFVLRDLAPALQIPTREPLSPARHLQPGSPYIKPAPLSPKLDHSQIYASPTNILPRRSRGLDFSRAATSLHHSTLANPGSPNSSPTIGLRAMNIPGGRQGGCGGGTDEAGPWFTASNAGGQTDRLAISSSLGSNTHMCSETSSSSDDEDEFMDENMEESYLVTPQASKRTDILASASPWVPGSSPAINNLVSFQQRQRPRRQAKNKTRGQLGSGFVSTAQNNMSKSPPNANLVKEMPSMHHRRESISWAANQLHISGSESDDNLKTHMDTVDSPSRPGIIRRAVTRRGNLLPKTKGFARIRAALAEESAPMESDMHHEAEVIRQVRESDVDLEKRRAQTPSRANTTFSSPRLGPKEVDDNNMSEDPMLMDPMAGGLHLSGTFKQQALRNSKGKVFWDTFSESGTGAARTGSSSCMSLEEMSLDSPSTSSHGAGSHPFEFPVQNTTSVSSGNETPQATMGPDHGSVSAVMGGLPTNSGPPSAAEITRRINGKRRRDDDFDPASFKRRAVSPGMSVHNSPVLQSPLQRDVPQWGPGSRPGSVGGDTTTRPPPGSGAPSENGNNGMPGNNTCGSTSGGRLNGAKGRVGFQGMVDTHDGITRLSIE